MERLRGQSSGGATEAAELEAQLRAAQQQLAETRDALAAEETRASHELTETANKLAEAMAALTQEKEGRDEATQALREQLAAEKDSAISALKDKVREVVTRERDKSAALQAELAAAQSELGSEQQAEAAAAGSLREEGKFSQTYGRRVALILAH